jgi:hypothetical protein
LTIVTNLTGKLGPDWPGEGHAYGPANNVPPVNTTAPAWPFTNAHGTSMILLCNEVIAPSTDGSTSVLDLTTGKSHYTSSLHHPRYFFTLTLYRNQVLVCSGSTGGVQPTFYPQLSSCETYSNGKWHHFPSLPIACLSNTVITLNNVPYAFGGAQGVLANSTLTVLHNVYRFNETQRHWHRIGNMPKRLFRQRMVALPDNTSLMCGGLSEAKLGQWDWRKVTHDCWIYTPSTDTWTPTGRMNTARGAQGLTVFKGVIYTFGGLTYNAANAGCSDTSPQSCVTYLNSLEQFHQHHHRWTPLPTPPVNPDFWFAYASLP